MFRSRHPLLRCSQRAGPALQGYGFFKSIINIIIIIVSRTMHSSIYINFNYFTWKVSTRCKYLHDIEDYVSCL